MTEHCTILTQLNLSTPFPTVEPLSCFYCFSHYTNAAKIFICIYLSWNMNYEVNNMKITTRGNI